MKNTAQCPPWSIFCRFSYLTNAVACLHFMPACRHCGLIQHVSYFWKKKKHISWCLCVNVGFFSVNNLLIVLELYITAVELWEFLMYLLWAFYKLKSVKKSVRYADYVIHKEIFVYLYQERLSIWHFILWNVFNEILYVYM